MRPATTPISFRKVQATPFESEVGHNDHLQFFEGNLETKNLAEKTNDKNMLDVLGTTVNVNSSL